MKILILTVGKPKNNFNALAKLAEEYLTRIKPADFIVTERVPDVTGGSQDNIIEREGEKLLKKLRPSDKVILMHDTGKEFSSLDFSKFLNQELNNAQGRLVFIIGGPWGVSQAVKDRADFKLSLSKMTFTHEMCYLFLCEQLYRAYSIIHGSDYHH